MVRSGSMTVENEPNNQRVDQKDKGRKCSH